MTRINPGIKLPLQLEEKQNKYKSTLDFQCGELKIIYYSKLAFSPWFVPFSSFPEKEEGESQGQSCQIEMVEQESYAYFFKTVAPKLLLVLILPTMTHFLRPSYALPTQNTLKLQ